MDKLVVQWILQHAMKHSYRRVIKEIFVVCPEIKCTKSMQEFSYAACAKFCSEKRDYDLNRRKMLWYCVRGFILSVPRIPVCTLRMCSQIIIILKWMIAVEIVISKESWPFSADVIETLSCHNQKFEKMWTTLAVEPIPWKEDYHELKLKLLANTSNATADYMALFKKIMDYLISCLEKCLEEMRSCLPSTVIEEVQCSKILHSFDDVTDLPANPWDRFNCVQDMLRKDSSEDGLLSLLKMLAASTSEEMSKVNEKSNSLYSSPNSSKFNLDAAKAMVFTRGKSYCRSSLPSPQSSCQRKQDSFTSINKKKGSAFEGGNLCKGDKKSMPSKDLNLSIEGGKQLSLEGGQIYDVQGSVITLDPPVKTASPAGFRMREKRHRRMGDVSDDESVAKKFAGGGVSNDRSIPSVGSVTSSVVTEAGSSCGSVSPLINDDEEELKIVRECDRVGMGEKDELEEMYHKESNAGQTSSPTVMYTGENLAFEDNVGETHGKNVPPVIEEVDGCLVRVVPENEINFPFSVDYPSQTAGTSGHDTGGKVVENGLEKTQVIQTIEKEDECMVTEVPERSYHFGTRGNVSENEVEEILIERVSVAIDTGDEELVSAVGENEIYDTCSSDFPNQTAETSDLVTGGNVINNEVEKTQVSQTIEKEDECLVREVPDNKIDLTCNVEYRGKYDGDIDQDVSEKVIVNEVEETQIKRVSPPNGKEDEKFFRIVAGNEINFTCSIDYHSQTADTSDHAPGGNITENQVEETLIKRITLTNDMGDEKLVGVVGENELYYTCSSDFPSQTAEISDDVTGGNVVNNEVEKTQVSHTIEKEDECLVTEVFENESNLTCNVDYRGKYDGDIGRNFSEKVIVNDVEKTQIKRVSPLNDKEDERLFRVVAENKINYTCSIDYPSQTAETNDHVLEVNVSENEVDETLIKRVSPINDMEDERFSRVVSENEINYSCSIDYSSQNERTSDLVTDGNVVANGVEKTQVSQTIEKEDKCMVIEVPENEIDITCNVDYRGKYDGDIERNISEKVIVSDVEETQIKRVSPLNDKEDERFFRVIAENEINFTCSIDYPRHTAEKSDHAPGGNVNENKVEETLINRVNPTNGMEDERLCRVVAENEINYTCSIDYPSQTAETSDLITGGNAVNNEVEKILVSEAIKKEDECMVAVLPENEINYPFSIDSPDQNDGASEHVIQGNIPGNVIVTENLEVGHESAVMDATKILNEMGDAFSCTRYSHRHGLDVNVPTRDMEVDHSNVSEKLDSELPLVFANTQGQAGVEVSTTLGECESSSISNGSIYVSNLDSRASDESIKNGMIITDYAGEGRNLGDNGPMVAQASLDYELSL